MDYHLHFWVVFTSAFVVQGQTTPSSPYPPECTGEYTVNTTLSTDEVFEVTLNTTVSNQTEVDMFLKDFNSYLGSFCDNNTDACVPSMEDDSAASLPTNFTTVYSCFLDSVRVVLGLVYSYNGQIISSASVLNAVRNGATIELLTYDFSVHPPTQNRTVETAVTSAEITETMATTDSMTTSVDMVTTDVMTPVGMTTMEDSVTTENFTLMINQTTMSSNDTNNSTLTTGLTTYQIVWVAVGASVSALLVSVLSGVLVILSLLSDKKAKQAQKPTLSLSTNNELAQVTRGDSPVLVSGGSHSKDRDMMPPGDL